MRSSEPDPITQTLALWLLYLVLAIAALSQLPRVAATIRQALERPVVARERIRL